MLLSNRFLKLLGLFAMSQQVMSASPVFLKATDQTWTTFDVCDAAEREIGVVGSMTGGQKTGQIWRLYPKSTEMRIRLLAIGSILIKGSTIPVLGRNPFIINVEDGETPVTKLFVGNVPISFSNDEIKNELERNKVEMVSRLTMERARNPRGEMTNWLTGRRFVWIRIPAAPLPTKLKMGIFTAYLFHKEMKENIKCFKCNLFGHKSFSCEKSDEGVNVGQVRREEGRVVLERGSRDSESEGEESEVEEMVERVAEGRSHSVDNKVTGKNGKSSSKEKIDSADDKNEWKTKTSKGKNRNSDRRADNSEGSGERNEDGREGEGKEGRQGRRRESDREKDKREDRRERGRKLLKESKSRDETKGTLDSFITITRSESKKRLSVSDDTGHPSQRQRLNEDK